MERLLTFIVRICHGSMEEFWWQINAKFDFPIGHFMLLLLTLTLEVLKSLHTLFDKYLKCMLVKFEQNRMVRNIQKFELFGKKWLTIIEKVLTPFKKNRRFCDVNNCSKLK